VWEVVQAGKDAAVREEGEKSSPYAGAHVEDAHFWSGATADRHATHAAEELHESWTATYDGCRGMFRWL